MMLRDEGPTRCVALNGLAKLARDTVQRPNAAELGRSLDRLSARAAHPSAIHRAGARFDP
jgi:hypothetical protein